MSEQAAARRAARRAVPHVQRITGTRTRRCRRVILAGVLPGIAVSSAVFSRSAGSHVIGAGEDLVPRRTDLVRAQLGGDPADPGAEPG